MNERFKRLKNNLNLLKVKFFVLNLKLRVKYGKNKKEC